MSRLLLVRHGDTELNSARRFQGDSDAELRAVGYRQAERLRDRLAVEKIDVIYSSDWGLPRESWRKSEAVTQRIKE